MSREVPAELILGPYDGRVGVVTLARDEPPRTLTFSLADKSSDNKLFVGQAHDDELTAVYVRIEEKPRKIVTIDDNGRARSELGVRYKYDAKNSPLERVVKTAEQRALLTADAAEQVNNTRQLLLARAKEQRS